MNLYMSHTTCTGRRHTHLLILGVEDKLSVLVGELLVDVGEGLDLVVIVLGVLGVEKAERERHRNQCRAKQAQRKDPTYTLRVLEPSTRMRVRLPMICMGKVRSSMMAFWTAVNVRERGLCPWPLF